jgi:hypothetical protein
MASSFAYPESPGHIQIQSGRPGPWMGLDTATYQMEGVSCLGQPKSVTANLY